MTETRRSAGAREGQLSRAHELFRFLLAGAINTCFGYGVFSLGVYCRLTPAMALLAANLLGICFNFLTYGRLVFRQLPLARAPLFVAVYAVNYFGNLHLLEAVRGRIASPYLAQLLVLPLSVLFL